MTYIELINAFWNKRLVYPLTSYEADFYMYLLKECNSRNWVNPFKLPTQIIEHDLNLNRRTICEIRNKLQNNGYINFTASTKRGEVTEYEIIDITNDPYANANRTQTERKPNANRTQSVTQTEHFYKDLDLDLDKEKLSKESKKKDEPSLFGAAPHKEFNGYNLDFVSDEWYPIFIKWLDYKRQRREGYKTERSLRTCYNQIQKYAENKILYADYIVDRSIANNWQGLFPLKQSDIDYITRQNSNGRTLFDPRSATAVPKRTNDDYDEEDD